jgi:hypothetical protein
MSLNDVILKTEQWIASKKSTSLVFGFFQSEVLKSAVSAGFKPEHMVIFASHKLPSTNGRASMLTFVARDKGVRKLFVKEIGLQRWYYYSQPSVIMGLESPKGRPVRMYLDFDAEDSKDEAGCKDLEEFSKTVLFDDMCDFFKVPKQNRTCQISTNHKFKDNMVRASVHLQSTAFHFADIHHYARCCRAYRQHLHSEDGNDVLQLLWKHYGATSSKNAQCEGVLDFAPIGTPTGTGYHKFNESGRSFEDGLDVVSLQKAERSYGAQN